MTQKELQILERIHDATTKIGGLQPSNPTDISAKLLNLYLATGAAKDVACAIYHLGHKNLTDASDFLDRAELTLS